MPCSVPGRTCAASESIGRIHSIGVLLSGPIAVNANRCPSGEIARLTMAGPGMSGGSMVKRRTATSFGGSSTCRDAGTRATSKPTTAMAATIQAVRALLFAGVGVGTVVSASFSSSVHFSSRTTSRAVCHRSSGSFCRHVRDDSIETGRDWTDRGNGRRVAFQNRGPG